MFEAAELSHKVSKAEFDAVTPELRAEMVRLQQDLRTADFPVIVLFAGVDGAGKSESVNLINEWMDPRWLVTRAYDKPSDEERERRSSGAIGATCRPTEGSGCSFPPGIRSRCWTGYTGASARPNWTPGCNASCSSNAPSPTTER
tara:strand:+ start:255 stop:689 length:435 start_codon:yes stop_codon:yes gene_type:complete